jgi:hypothetical protein
MSFFKIKTTPWLLIIATIVAVSPLVSAYSPIKGNIVSILALFIILCSKNLWDRVNQEYFVWCLIIGFSAFISSVYWQELRMMLIPIYFVLSILVISVLNKHDIKVFVEILTRLVMIFLFGAVFGTFYAYYGGVPILDFANPDGRLNQLYLTTLTNSQIENFIRPSGVFDEPGALSFVACFIAALRHSTGGNKKITWIMLILGMVTMSVAHLVYVLLHAAEELKSHKRAKDVFMFLGVVAICSWVLVSFIQPIQDILSALLFSRFTDDTLSTLGQDRVTTLLNAVGYININTFMFGLDSDCALGFANCTFDKGFDNYSDNPLTLLVHWGWLLAFPYYFVLAYLAFNSVRQRNFIMFGIMLLLLQRPYTMSYGYSMLIVLTLFVLAGKHEVAEIRKSSKVSSASDVLPTV